MPSSQAKTGQPPLAGDKPHLLWIFIATSQLLAVMLLVILLGAVQVPLSGTLLATAMLLAVCVPAARVVAILVEKKRHTFTIVDASFVGIVLAPFCIVAACEVLNGFFSCYLPLLPALAAMAIAYTLGEGLGRLAHLFPLFRSFDRHLGDSILYS